MIQKKEEQGFLKNIIYCADMIIMDAAIAAGLSEPKSVLWLKEEDWKTLFSLFSTNFSLVG